MIGPNCTGSPTPQPAVVVRNDSGKSYTEEDCSDCGGAGKIITEEIPPEDDPFRQ
jgi:hypothetical protein